MARRFEADYRVTESDDVLARENDIHRDIDLRLDDVEKGVEAFRSGQRDDIEAILNNLEETYSGLAAEMRRLLDQAEGGLSADIIVESTARYFLTDARRAAILADVRGNVDGSADTLAKLLVKISDASTAAAAAATSAAGRVSKSGDTMAGDLTVGLTNRGTVALVGGDTTRSGYLDIRTPNGGRVGYIGYSLSGQMEYVSNSGRHSFIGAIATSDLGDLKTYVDKGVRTEVVQAFASADRVRAKKNIGALGCNYSYLLNGAVMDASSAGDVYLVNSGAVIALPPISQMKQGDGIVFQGWNGTFSLSSAEGANINYNGTNSASISVRQAQTAFVFSLNGSWYVFGMGAPQGSAPSYNEAQTVSDAQKKQFLANADIAIPHGQCRLNFVSSTQVRLDGRYGNKIFINGNYRTIPSGGVTLGNGGLAASTRYYVYAYWTGSALALQTVAAGSSGNAAPVVSSTYGNMIAGNGDNNFALVGQVCTNAAAQFQDDKSWRGVASHFNKRWRPFGGTVSSGGQTTAQSRVNLGAQFMALNWDGDAVKFTSFGNVQNNTALFNCAIQNYLDTTAQDGNSTASAPAANAFSPVSVTNEAEPAEGLHTYSTFGSVSGNTGTFYITMSGEVLI